jgi:hypothetical protein
VPLLHAVSRSEATPTYKALLDALVRVAENTGYHRISIASVQMDHSRAIRNAVRQHSEYTVIIDCRIHVARGMLKNKHRLVSAEYGEVAHRHFTLLHSIGSRELFDAFKTVVLRTWREAGEDAYADWFESVYLAEAWDGGCFFAGVAGIPGVANHNQCIESYFRYV